MAIAHIATAATASTPITVAFTSAPTGEVYVGVLATGMGCTVGGLGLSWSMVGLVDYIIGFPPKRLYVWRGSAGVPVAGDLTIASVGMGSTVNAYSIVMADPTMIGVIAFNANRTDLGTDPFPLTMPAATNARNTTLAFFCTEGVPVYTASGAIILGQASSIASMWSFPVATTIAFSHNGGSHNCAFGLELGRATPNTTLALRHIGKTSFILTEP